MAVKLPTKKKPVEQDFDRYLILLYGREKIGKSTLFASFPDTLFFTTEPGTKGLEIYEIACSDWKTIKEAVALLQKEKRFRRVVFDTVDRAYDMCLDYVCKRMGIAYPGTSPDGREDYGKSWREVRQEFMKIINDIVWTGRGVAFTSHATESEIRTRSGDQYTRIFPTMSRQARTVVEPLVDFFFFADYVRDVHGDIQRIIITEGDETIWAGTRKGIGEFPPMLPLLPKGGYEVLLKAFQGQHPGVDPMTLLAGRQTSPVTAKYIQKRRATATAKAKMPLRRKRT